MKCSLASPPQKPGKRERWVFNVSNANKKVKVGQDEVKFESSHEKGECSNGEASESFNGKEANANTKVKPGEGNVANSNVKKAVAGCSAVASKVLINFSFFEGLRYLVEFNLT